jgi:hypothetical protein
MSTSNKSTFDAGSVDRVLDEFRSTNAAVEALFNVHVGKAPAESLDRQTVEDALITLNANVCLALHHANQHIEYLHYTEDGWYLLTEISTKTVGPIALYPHNVSDRLGEYELDAVRVDATPLATAELPKHGLDETEVVLDV